MVVISIPSFKLNRFPKPSLNEGFLRVRGIAPSNIPCGQMYLQKYGGITSYLPFITKVNAIINENKIPYFINLNTFSFFVDSFYKVSYEEDPETIPSDTGSHKLSCPP